MAKRTRRIPKACNDETCFRSASPGQSFCETHRRIEIKPDRKVSNRVRSQLKKLTEPQNCNRCYRWFHVDEIEVDHIVALANGGEDHINNLQLLCKPCHVVKTNEDMEY